MTPIMSVDSYVDDDLSGSVIAAAIEVHRCLGAGFFESVYEEVLFTELTLRGLAVRRQVPLSISYRGRSIAAGRVDLLVEEALVLELKAVEAIDPIHIAQLKSYLKAGAFPVGLLINFNVVLLRHGLRRIRAPG